MGVWRFFHGENVVQLAIFSWREWTCAVSPPCFNSLLSNQSIVFYPHFLSPPKLPIMAIQMLCRQRYRTRILLLIILLANYLDSLHQWLYLQHGTILHPTLSPWRQLMDHGDDSSFLHMTGLSQAAFNMLLSFPRCRKCLPSDPIKQRLVIESIISIHNFCTDVVGFNQIATGFYLEYERVVNLEG